MVCITEEVVEELSSKQKLERDKALNKLIVALPTYDPSVIECLYSAFLSVIKKTDAPWESYHGVLQAIKVLLSQKNAPTTDDHLLKEIRECATNLLEYNEVRVRLAAGEVLGALCALDGCSTFIQLRGKILLLIRSNLERDHIELDDSNDQDLSTEDKLMEKLNAETRGRRNSGDASQIFHDTAGWRNLETSMKCLENMIYGCGNNFLPFIDQELLELLFTALVHTNRFVRETGFFVIAALVSCGLTEGEDPSQGNPMLIYGDQLTEHLGKGLADNWSQVRLAASEASRKFLVTLPIAARERFFPILLPRICLNRYYLAEGVRLYSQETWRQITGNEGKVLVEKYIDHVVGYYIEATAADNHSVREAACECIAELALKIPEKAVRPHVQTLLQTLKMCFNDDSWPVRDAAGLACGNFISSFPEESLVELETLFPQFFMSLQDCIPSVRQGAATALHDVVKAYPDVALNRVLDWIKESLKGVANQPSEAKRYGDLESGAAVYGVVKRKRDNDVELHSDKQMYSCGSLAPKMGRGLEGGLDRRFRRPAQEWEKADGCIYLVGELSSIPTLAGEITRLLPLIATSCGLKHYTAHFSLLETLCKILPVIAKGIGKKLFKSNLHLFIDSIFYALQSENSLSSSAASLCLNQLSQFLGPNILRGRIEEFNPSYLQALDANTFIAPM